MSGKRDVRRSPALAVLYGAPIGLLGGLIGLGGAEFRLPVLAAVFGYAARRAVALNLAISLVTVVSALLICGGTLPLAPVLGLLPVALAIVAGSVWAAFVGVAEGEPATDALLAAHFPAVGTVTGAEGAPGQEALEVLRDRRVILWPDNDVPGRDHMDRVAAALHGIAAEVRIFEWTEAPEKGADAADHLAIRSCKRSEIGDLLTEMVNASVWEPEDAETLSDHPIGSRFGQNELPLKTPQEIVEAAEDSTDWIVEGLLAPGEITVLAGVAKYSGKTTFITHMLAAVISGEKVMGFATREVKVLYLTEQGNNFANALKKSGLVDAGIPSLIQRAAGFDVPDFLAAGLRDVLVPASLAEEAKQVLEDTTGLGSYAP